jgi:hypothetical protein
MLGYTWDTICDALVIAFGDKDVAKRRRNALKTCIWKEGLLSAHVVEWRALLAKAREHEDLSDGWAIDMFLTSIKDVREVIRELRTGPEFRPWPDLTCWTLP